MRSTLPLVALLIGCTPILAAEEAPTIPRTDASDSPEPIAPRTFTSTTVEDRIPEVAEAVIGSVVSIQTTRAMQPASVDPRYGLPFPMPRQQPSGGLGSGVLVGEGLVVTNHHVVDQASGIVIALHDGRELEAELVGSDANSDVAVLRIEDAPVDLPSLQWGDSRALRLGETVLAIGNPFGMGHSVTQGIVSAKGRVRLGITDYEDFIQTDAAINPGNSGGALVTLDGRVVGINTAIMSRSGGNQGIGLAIPAHMAERVVADLADDGVVSRGWLGVAIQDLDPALADVLELPDTRGVLLGNVTEGSPADAAGFEAGDVVRTFDGEAVANPSDFRNRVALAGADHRFVSEVLRNGRTKKIKGILGAHPDSPVPTASAVAKSESPATLGVSVRATRDGMLIERVQPGSLAAQAGLQPGEVILEIDRRPADAQRLEDALNDGEALLRVKRGDYVRFVAVRKG